MNDLPDFYIVFEKIDGTVNALDLKKSLSETLNCIKDLKEDSGDKKIFYKLYRCS